MTLRNLFMLTVVAIFFTCCTAVSVCGQTMNVTRLASGLSRPVFATTAPSDQSRLFVLEQHAGQIEILNTTTGSKNATPFLNLGGLVSTGNEQGLLGLAFHPDYLSNGLFYVNYTNTSGDTEIREFSRASPDSANPGSGRLILSIDQPQPNHNAGWMDFGRDGNLYIATGDGGGGNDDDPGHTPGIGNSQDTTGNLLGKILRIDVNGDDFGADPNRNYAIPTSNPFVGQSDDDEIWAYGLRNPYRNSFDRETGDLYIADVGQNLIEEINIQLDGSLGGENYGWRLREGTRQTPGSVGGPKPAGAIDPIYEFLHGSGDLEGFSVTGGYVYRGPISELDGHYFFADYVNQRIWSFKYDGTDPSLATGDNVIDFIDWTDLIVTDAGEINGVSSFGEDELGNLYIVDLGGEIFRIDFATIPEPAGVLVILLFGSAVMKRRTRSS